MVYDRRATDPDLPRPPEVSFDYRRELGRVFVPLNAKRECSVLDPERAATLRAWTAALIPARGARPAADEVGAAEYIDATLFRAPRLRAALLAAIDALDRQARQQDDAPFAACDCQRRAALLGQIEASRHGDVFAMVRELTYEAYYADPRILAILEAETGWRYETAFSGETMEPFDERLLERMKAVAPRYRRVPEE